MADYNSDRTGSNIDLTLDKVDALDAKVQPTATGVSVTGKVGINTANPQRTLDVQSDSGDADARIYARGTASTDDAILYLGIAGTTATNRINFGDADDADRGRIIYDHTSDFMSFTTSSSERARISSDGDVSFFEDTGTTAKFVWDASAENVSIGSIEGVANGSLSLKTTTSGHAISLEENSGTERWQMGVNVDGDLEFVNSADANPSIVFDDSGNVGIGTASPSGALDIGGQHVLNDNYDGIGATFRRNGTYGSVVALGRKGVSDGVTLDYPTANTLGISTGGAERARIDSSGNLLVGCTALNAQRGFAVQQGAATNVQIMHNFGQASGTTYAQFLYATTAIGSITQSGETAVLYNTSSDQRLKENIQDTTHTVDIDDIQVREFDWKVDGSHQRYGFIAQELETVYPEAVHSPEDADEMKSVDYSKLVPLLVKEIQQLKAEIKELKA